MNDIDFSEMVRFSKWILNVSELGVKKRYLYIDSGDYFIDDYRNRFSWEEIFEIYKEQKDG